MYWILYAKFPNQKRFAPVDWREGVQVVNRIYATTFNNEERAVVQKDLEHPLNASTKWDWRKAG